MIFTSTGLPGAFVIEPELQEDERGFFSRVWCAREFESHGLNPRLAQCNISFNERKGTLRGMHYQQRPHQEAKLMRCTQGAIYDVVVDLRQESPAYKQSFGTVLTASNRRMLYAPEGFAHGFLTLEEHTEVFYQMSEFYAPGSGRGFRWNDPAFGISWPGEVAVICQRDRTYPDFVSP
jgi:dTDP-4-dehydrorhamnose 3,5-epimerase